MVSHISLSCACLSILLTIVSSRMMLHYPMDLGNYVDYRQDLAGDLLKHRYELASNLYSDNIYPANIGIPHAGFGMSHVVSDPIFGGQIISDPLLMGVPQQTIYVQSPAHTVDSTQAVQPAGRIAQQANTQPKVTWINLDQQTPLNTVLTQTVPKDMSSFIKSAGGPTRTSATIKNVDPMRVASMVAKTAQTDAINITKKAASKTIDSTKRVPKKKVPNNMNPKKRVPKKQTVPQNTEATETTTTQRRVAWHNRPQFPIQSKVNTSPRRSFQRGSSTRNRDSIQSRLRLLRAPSKNNRRVSQKA